MEYYYACSAHFFSVRQKHNSLPLERFSLHLLMLKSSSVTRRKSTNVYKICPKSKKSPNLVTLKSSIDLQLSGVEAHKISHPKTSFSSHRWDKEQSRKLWIRCSLLDKVQTRPSCFRSSGPGFAIPGLRWNHSCCTGPSCPKKQ